MIDQLPSIMILKSADVAETKLLQEVCWGIEEEGIPFEVQPDPENSAVKLAYKAALNSRLNVGIGMGADDTIAIHHSQLDEKEALFVSNNDARSCSHFNIGINAARLVKGLPLKEI